MNLQRDWAYIEFHFVPLDTFIMNVIQYICVIPGKSTYQINTRMKLFELLSPVVSRPAGAYTQYTCLDVIKDICGAQNVTTDRDNATENQILVITDTEDDPGYSPASPSENYGSYVSKGSPAQIRIPNPSARDARSVALTAHEACHAWLAMHSKGRIFNNEKMTNAAATKWLTAHLSGMTLRVALDLIMHSKISYGHSEPSFVKPKLPG